MKKVLIAAPIIVLLVIFLHAYLQLVHAFVLFRHWDRINLSARLRVTTYALYDAGVVVVNSAALMLDREDVPRASELPTINLRTQPGSLEKMLSSLPGSAKARYYPAQLAYPDGVWRPVQYRLRGRSSWHWLVQKPSLRVKLRKSAPLGLQRHLNLVSPEDRPMISNILGESVARDMGILTPETEFVRVFLNEKFHGVYHLTTREDESWLRLRNRVPGPLFIGDRLDPRGWRLEQFETAGDEDVLEYFNPLARLLEVLVSPSGPGQHESMWEIISKEKVAGWLAATSIVGSIHTDGHHNHLYYFDPSTGQLEPAVSDFNGHGLQLFPQGNARIYAAWEPLATLPLNGRIHPVSAVALRDPHLRHRRNLALFDALHGVASVRSQHQKLDGYYRKVDPDAHADHRKGAIEKTFIDWYRMPYTNRQYETAKRQVYRWIEARNAFLLAELEALDVMVLRTPAKGASGRIRLAIIVRGHSAASFDAASLGGRLQMDRDLDGKVELAAPASLLLHPGLEVQTRPKGEGFRQLPARTYGPGSEVYLFEITDAPEDLAERLKTAFHNGVTGSPLTASLVTEDELRKVSKPSGISVHSWRYRPPAMHAVSLGPGEVQLESDLVIGPRQSLNVAAGTRLRLGEGVSILSRGKVTISGSADAPVSIERLNPDKPWGALVMQGDGSRGSSIEHASISGGSLATDSHVRYSGMVSVHWSDDFSIRNSSVSDNVLSDDTLHIVNSAFQASDLTLNSCFSDCIDLDYARGTIDRLDVRSARNDGVDLMSSDVSISDAAVSEVGDKGLSVGEGTTLLARNLRVDRSVTGLAVKDKSRVSLASSELNRNETGIDVFAKNWRYGGPGAVSITGTSFGENQVNLRVEEGGEAVFEGQPLPEKRSGEGVVRSQPARNES